MLELFRVPSSSCSSHVGIRMSLQKELEQLKPSSTNLGGARERLVEEWLLVGLLAKQGQISSIGPHHERSSRLAHLCEAPTARPRLAFESTYHYPAKQVRVPTFALVFHQRTRRSSFSFQSDDGVPLARIGSLRTRRSRTIATPCAWESCISDLATSKNK